MGGKSAHAAQCYNSPVLTKLIGLILHFESFEQQCVIIKGLLQSDQLKKNIVTIEIDQSLSNCEMYEHRCLKSINKLYTSSGKCDYQLQFKAILEE